MTSSIMTSYSDKFYKQSLSKWLTCCLILTCQVSQADDQHQRSYENLTKNPDLDETLGAVWPLQWPSTAFTSYGSFSESILNNFALRNNKHPHKDIPVLSRFHLSDRTQNYITTFSKLTNYSLMDFIHKFKS